MFKDLEDCHSSLPKAPDSITFPLGAGNTFLRITLGS